MKYRVRLVNPDLNVVDHDRANWFIADQDGEVLLFDSLEDADVAGLTHVDDDGPWNYEVEEAGE